MFSKLADSGFTLIELMVVVAIAAILLVLGVPTMTVYMEGAKVRHIAESFYNAALAARAEAIRTNQVVALQLTGGDPWSANSTPNISGPNWSVRSPSAIVAAKAVEEGKADQVSIVGSVSSLSFDGLGRLVSFVSGQGAPAATFQFKHNQYNSSCDTAGSVRCLNVIISPGGQARLCEPGVSGSRAC